MDFRIEKRNLLQVSNRICLIKDDVNSTKVTIICPKWIDGINILEKQIVAVYKINSNIKQSGYLPIINQNEQEVLIEWWLEKEVCEYIGSVDFQITITDRFGNYIYQTKSNKLLINSTIEILNTGEIDGALLDRLGDYLITIDGDYLLYKEGV